MKSGLLPSYKFLWENEQVVQLQYGSAPLQNVKVVALVYNCQNHKK